MEVKKIYTNKDKDYYIAEMKGNPLADFDQFDERYGLLVVSSKVYYIDESDLDNMIQYTSTNSMIPIELLERTDLMFEFPLYNGEKYGSVSTLTRTDFRYMWTVAKKDVIHQKENNEMKNVSLYEMKNITIGDSITITYIPNLGIISKEYKHNGTTNKQNIELYEYNVKMPEKPKGTSLKF
ncbi:hypothetical protein H1S01_16765 [Heliobacterium chlorum]|uniref:Uncharacterized protein n=1 Tax=Heliobacterium chlorum TaxID=2698 RepID=A0ABR7T5R3_HELCL|nr:hypothetical protein [Heliobacterium chlorum]MBC9786122.1 hypothetical protein [Heliobacterium chlorum]